jgi:hypothetical protein
MLPVVMVSNVSRIHGVPGHLLPITNSTLILVNPVGKSDASDEGVENSMSSPTSSSPSEFNAGGFMTV